MKSVAIRGSEGLRFLAALAFATMAVPRTTEACSVCGCSLSSDWTAQGYGNVPGFEGNVRYEYFNETDLRHGSHSVDLVAPESPSANELQRETLNRNLWVGLDYAWPSLSLSFSIPYYDRFHSTIASGDTAISQSNASGVGDMRVIARLGRSSTSGSSGLELGLKLPTGQFDQDFYSGPKRAARSTAGCNLEAARPT